MYKHLMGGNKEDTRLMSVVPSDRTRVNEHKLGTLSYCESGQTLEQASHRGISPSVEKFKLDWTQTWETWFS